MRSCSAPFASLYLDQHGFARACCMNVYQLLGNVAERSLREIWDGAALTELRRAVERHDLTVGCEFCKWRVDEGREDLAFARWFDEYDDEPDDPRWPRQLELSISNTCNLQCVMCNGEWSSSIRSQREHREPLPTVYGDRFFEELVEFVPHLRRVKVLGASPSSRRRRCG
ncbi:MAG: SPASM domain-containing protein [Microthrixaceae bacterium]